MCYDNSLKKTVKQIEGAVPFPLIVKESISWEPTFHKIGMSYPAWPVIFNHHGARLEDFIWGPIPESLDTIEKIKNERQFFLNARSEKVLKKGTLWNDIKHQRCLIPSAAFFEYRYPFKDKPKEGYCYAINQGADKIFFIAGLWSLSNSWDVDKPEPIPTFTLLTRDANKIMRQIHNGGKNPFRMPLMLAEDMLEQWLQPDLSDDKLKEFLDFSFPSERLEYWPVSSVRKRHEDNESVLEKVEYLGLPPIEA
ncbi:SOS response-associated peptidase [Chryseobacterium sp. 22543]|uniref:SOS response-associated peptidase n=1 Tax=Chryseobacterium sp. 22543 TaxID=3453940 RepID=UPI003F85BAFD